MFDKIVVPLVKRVCDSLRQERENEIRRQALHGTQRNNELSCYMHSVETVEPMLKKNVGYINSAPFRLLQKDIEAFLSKRNNTNKQKEARQAEEKPATEGEA